MRQSNRLEKIAHIAQIVGVALAAIAIVVAIAVPEFRQWLGLEKPAPTPTSTATLKSTEGSQPSPTTSSPLTLTPTDAPISTDVPLPTNTEINTPMPPTPTPVPTEPEPLLPGWVICWHGRAEHEYLIAYPEVHAREGINLTTPMKRPWDGNAGDLTNDSLKMCLFNGIWHGSSLLQYFPFASYLRLEQGHVVVCENAPGCGGEQWLLRPNDSPPSVIVKLLHLPSGGEMQILDHMESSQLP